MRWMFFLLAWCVVSGSALAQNLSPLKLNEEWRVFLKADGPFPTDRIPEKLVSAKGVEIPAREVKFSANTVDLAALCPEGFHEKDTAVLYNEFTCESAGQVRIGLGADYWMEVYINGTLALSTMKSGNEGKPYTPEAFVFDTAVKAGRNLIVAKVVAGSNGWRLACGTPAGKASVANVRFEAGDEWKPVNLESLLVKAGSALDQRTLSEVLRSAVTPATPGAVQGLPRLGVGPTGRLVIANRPDKTVRLRGTHVNTPHLFDWARRDPNWKDTWKGEAEQARLQGYNMIRLWTDAIYHQDMNITPDQLDKFDYFTSMFGARGVYTFLTVGSYGLYLKNAWGALPPGERRDYRLRMYLGDEPIRRAWKYGVETLMNHVNAYTGVAWKDDPNIACVELFNEQEWGFLYPKSKLSTQTQLEFDSRYRSWLQARYKTPEALAKAWGAATLTSFDDIKTPDDFPFNEKRASDHDFIEFCSVLSRESAAWMRQTLRATGYKGLVAQYNLSPWMAAKEVRWEESQVSIANGYHNHPTAFDSPGSKCNQASSLGTGGWYIRSIAGMRFADRPFMVTEYNHSFWNPYQYEGGILMGAYSALNGFDVVLLHGNPVFYYTEKPGIRVFTTGYSPVARAGEFLLGCLYLRQDVQTSPHRVELQIPKTYLQTNGGRSVSNAQGKIAFLTGFSLAFPWAKRAEGVGNPPPPDLVLTPDSGGEFATSGGGWAIDGKESAPTNFSLDMAVREMKAKGVLPASNLSEPARGIFQSDTGEIILRERENLLKVVTARSEAVAMEGGKSEPVGLLAVERTSVPALVAACAVDREKLAASKRIVLLYSTQVANTGMELSPDRATMVNLGKAPVLMRTGTLAVTLKNGNGSRMSLYALGLDGSRQEKLPVKFSDGVLRILIDTATLKNGPTPFFELVAE